MTIDVEELKAVVERERAFYETPGLHTIEEGQQYDGYKTMKASQLLLQLLETNPDVLKLLDGARYISELQASIDKRNSTGGGE